MKFHNLLVIALVIIRHTHKANRNDRGAENPTGLKLPDFILPYPEKETDIQASSYRYTIIFRKVAEGVY